MAIKRPLGVRCEENYSSIYFAPNSVFHVDTDYAVNGEKVRRKMLDHAMAARRARPRAPKAADRDHAASAARLSPDLLAEAAAIDAGLPSPSNLAGFARCPTASR
jgi:hypothetical protein